MNAPVQRVWRARRWIAVVLALVAALLITWGARSWHVAQVSGAVEARQAERVTSAEEFVTEDFERLTASLMRQAQSVASRDDLIQGLRSMHRQNYAGGLERVTGAVAELDLQQQRSVEIYDPIPRLLAWSGFAMPLDEGPDAADFLQRPVTSIASDDGLRKALVVWWPIRDGRNVLGLVRVMEQIRYNAPVQNQYVQDYRLEDRWRERTGMSIQVEYGRAEDDGLVLHNEEGVPLLTVHVEEPSAERLIAHTVHFYDGLMAFWVALLLCLVVGGAWQWYRKVGTSAERRSVHYYLRQAGFRFLVVSLVWWGVRYAFLGLDVPGRWISTTGPLAPLFDPTHLASALGGGLLRSTGDLLVTGVFAFAFAAGLLDLATRFRNKGLNLMNVRHRLWEREAVCPSAPRFFAVLFAVTLLSTALTGVVAQVASRAVLDSTLDYVARTGLFPDLLTLVVFCALLLITIAVLLTIASAVWVGLWFLFRYWPKHWSTWAVGAGASVTVLVSFLVVFLLFGGLGAVSWLVALVFLVTGISIAAFGFLEPGAGVELLTLRRLLPALLLVTVLLYPLLYAGMDTERRERMVDAVDSFREGRDPRVLFSMEQVLQELRRDPAAVQLLEAGSQEVDLDSLAERALRGSLLTGLGTYEVTLGFFDGEGRPVGQFTALGPGVGRTVRDDDRPIEFNILRQIYTEVGAVGTMVEQLTGPRARHRFQYAGLVPIFHPDHEPVMPSPGLEDERPEGWAVVWAEPHSLLPESGTPFPRVLLPAGHYGDLYAHFSLAEFRQGVLIRSLGRDFGRYRLDDRVQETLRTQPALWDVEEVKGRSHLTYYHRHRDAVGPEGIFSAQPAGASVTAVRAPAIITFDHLYYVLRLFIASLFIGVFLYALGLILRWMRGQLPAEQVNFRDKMQNAFLIVGAVSVVVVGIIGVQVLMDENERSTQNWLRQRLEQVEETLMLEADADEMPHQTIERVGLDSLAVRVGLDLNLYRDGILVESSRPRLVRERLISERMSPAAFHSLYFDGYRFTTTQEQIGDFAYTAGFRALTDEEGYPRYVLSVPTLPEQERMEEEQARTIAYLFGALLLLVVIIMFTASLLAGALARPIARLRGGLEAVGKGEFARALPVDTRDEVGDLVQTFNEMREQLAESRRKLAQQERELAWREMARQVAHEIKNPLTPMKLSVQHLRRAFERQKVPAGGENGGIDPRFEGLFDRITNTLIEQIDALARIANEFSSFSRLPTRMPELLDLNEVVGEAVSLMQEEAGVEIYAQLHEDPLVAEADKEELRRAYINIIKNGVQAIPEDREGEIRVTTEFEPGVDHTRGFAFSTVTDNGTGIPPELQEKIFQPNFSTKNSGTGLGLAIVRKSIEDMNGDIGFDTTEGEGTTFWIRLPLADEPSNP